MSEISIRSKVLTGLFWKIMENGGTQGVQFIVSVVLARMLTTEETGDVMLVMIFIAIANVFVQSGINTSLIQKREAGEADYSTAFYISFSIAAFMYVVLYAASPAVAGFYGQPVFRKVLRVLALTLFFGSATSVQTAKAARDMEFRQICMGSLAAACGSGVIGVCMASAGYGLWALVAQQLSYSFLLMMVLGFLVSWRPRGLFSAEKGKELFSYGWKILCSGLIDTIFNNVYGLVIGKLYDSHMMAQYSKGNQFPSLIATNLGSAIQSVMLPAFSSYQEKREEVKGMMRRAIVTSSFLVFPMMAGLIAVAEPLVRLILTEKYLPCVPFLRIMCVAYACWPLHVVNLQAINALGRSDIFLKLEIVKKIVGIAALLLSLPFGIYAMVGLKALTDFICTFINAYPNKKLLHYSFLEQWRDVFPSFLLSSVMCAAVYGITFLIRSPAVALVVQIAAGVAVYFGLAWIFKMDSLFYLFRVARGLRGEK